jgi:hypothetical protein
MEQAAGYQVRIRLQGELEPSWSTLFAGLVVERGSDGTTVLVGELADQAAVHGILGVVRDLGLSLLSVEAFAGIPSASTKGVS